MDLVREILVFFIEKSNQVEKSQLDFTPDRIIEKDVYDGYVN